MPSLLDQGDLSKLKYLVAWTYGSDPSSLGRSKAPVIRMRTELAGSKEDVWNLVFKEAIRHSVMLKERDRAGEIFMEPSRSPYFRVEVFLSL